MVRGERGAYRSLSELREQYPWLTEEAIRKALGRAEKALNGWFVVDRENPNAERDKLHYWISPKLIKKYRFAEERKGLLQLQVDDVMKYGVIEAVLISNLDFVTEATHNSNPLVDDEGRIYRELSPTKLTKVQKDLDGVMKSILPCKRNKLTEALAHLVAEDVMAEHPERRGFYRLKSASERVSKVAGDDSKVASRVSKVASDDSKVAGQTVVMPCKQSDNKHLQQFCETPDTNTCSNADTNSDTKCLFPPTATLRSSVGGIPSNASDGAKKLMSLLADGLAAIRHKPKHHRQIIHDKDEVGHGTIFCQPDKDIEICQQGFHEISPYDVVAIDVSTGKAYNRNAEIDNAIADIKVLLAQKQFGYKKKDIDELRQWFVQIPSLEYEHISTLVDFLQPQTHGLYIAPIKPHKSGHDGFYFARRIKTLGALLRYRRQLIQEFHVHETEQDLNIDVFGRDDNGRPNFSYAELPEPYFSLAYAGDTTHPVAWAPLDNEDIEYRPVFYAEHVGMPGREVVEHECNPVPTDQ